MAARPRAFRAAEKDAGLGPAADLPYTQLAYNSQTIGQIANVTTGLTPLNLPTNGANPRVYTVGKVVATGNGRVNEKGEVLKLDVKVGDVILFEKYGGEELKILSVQVA